MFLDVDAMIFVIPSSYYDVVLNRDRSRNRLTEAIEHFNDIVNYKYEATTVNFHAGLCLICSL